MTHGRITLLIIDTIAAHPDWTASDIAQLLDMHPASVRGVASKLHITIPSEHLKRARERTARVALVKKPFRKVAYCGKPKGSVY